MAQANKAMNAKEPMTPKVICSQVSGFCSGSGMSAILTGFYKEFAVAFGQLIFFSLPKP
jgi:hypothetical protein